VLSFLRSKSKDVLELIDTWKTRMIDFKGSMIAWERILNLRRIVFPFASNMSFYVIMISKLSKDKAFKIIDQYFRKFYDGGID
jgi:hypothetical protein